MVYSKVPQCYFYTCIACLIMCKEEELYSLYGTNWVLVYHIHGSESVEFVLSCTTLNICDLNMFNSRNAVRVTASYVSVLSVCLSNQIFSATLWACLSSLASTLCLRYLLLSHRDVEMYLVRNAFWRTGTRHSRGFHGSSRPSHLSGLQLKAFDSTNTPYLH